MSDDAAKRDYSQLMKSALVELKTLRARLDELTRARTEPIAIVGMGCHLPGGANGPDSYWDLLRGGVDAISEVPPDRWDAATYYDANPDLPGRIVSRYGGFLDGIDRFDPAFFGISPREARSLDPQQRLLLEVTWEALEHAGQSPAQLYGSATGVFIGMSTFDYALHQVGGAAGDDDMERIDGYVATGSTMSPAAGRLSYVLGLNGPSLVVDTACSSSLVAAHLAVASLRSRECDLALVGGVNIVLRPEWNVNFTRAHMLAPDGRCKTFDAAADGYTRGEGCVVLVLQRLTDALAAGCRIAAVIRGTAVNQDGASGGLTVPSGPSQEQVIRRALDSAGLRPDQIGYVEAHGTGTSLGDPIEVAALGAVFGEGRPAGRPLRIGSVKTNIGHLEAAAGAAGLMKVALALRHAEIPPHLHFKTRNPLIDWDRLPIEVPVAPAPWPAGSEPRRAGISSFGFTGTNAHVVLEEAPAEHEPLRDAAPTAADRPVHLLALSARTEDALRELAGRYERHLAARPDVAIADVAFTAGTGRSHFRHRLAVVADSAESACTALAEWSRPAAARAALDDAHRPDAARAETDDAGGPGSAMVGIDDARGPGSAMVGIDDARRPGSAMVGIEPSRTRRPAPIVIGQGTETPRTAFLFTGQGAQYPGMGQPLYETEPVFREAIDRCDALLRPHLERPLLDVLYGPADATSALDETAYTQPALFALEYALAALWRSWGIVPAAVMGHSVGEYVAACLAGIFSLEDALALIAARARLMQALPRAGAMMAVAAGAERAAAAIAAHAPDTVSIAAINAPGSVVVSGLADDVAAVAAALAAEGCHAQALRVSHAFHSPLMEPMLAEFERVARGLTYSAPTLVIVSNLTGRPAGGEMASADYWVRHVRQPVRFAGGMASLHEHGCRAFVEIGPGSTLLGLGKASVPGDAAAAWLPSLRAGHEWEQVLRSLGELYVRGAVVDWAALDRAHARRRVALPTYPFQRQRFWIDIERRRPGDDPRPARDATGAAMLVAPAADAVQHPASALDGLLYETAWREGGRLTGLAEGAADGHWVILQDEGPIGMLLARRLRARGARCTLVSAGDGFVHLDAEHLRVNPSRPKEMARVLSSVTAHGPVRALVHLWSLDALATRYLDAPGLEASPMLHGLLHTLQAVMAHAGGAPPAVWTVTRGAVPAGGSSEPLALAQAPVWGFGRTMALEQPALWGGLVDLEPAGDPHADAEALARVLLAPGGEDQLAIRGGAVCVPRLVARERPAGSPPAIDPDGVYLVAGGLGALGQHVARWLVSRGARTLVLTSRRGMGAPGTDAAVRRLEMLGARRVVVLAADLARDADAAGVIAEAERLGRLRGLVHAAGIDAPAPLAAMTAGELRSMLASKVAGGWLLHDLTRDRMLDLFVLFSSVSAIWGAPGRAHYAAANAFLDALAHERRRLGLHALSVNWGPWRGGGMARDEDLRHLDRSGHRALDPPVAMAALETLLAGQDPQATVADVDWPRFRAAFEARRPRPIVAEADRAARKARRPPDAASAVAGDQAAPGDRPAAASDWLERLRAVPAGKRLAVLEALLRAEVATTLGYQHAAQVPIDQSVFELGMDSLRAVDLAVRLQRHLGLERSVQFFDCPQVTALAARMLSNLAVDLPQSPAPDAGDQAAALADVSGVTLYSAMHDQQIVEFSRIAWPGRAEALIAPRWRWMFVESAERLGRPPRVWIYREQGRIVGHHGAIPVRLDAGDELLESAWFADTMILEEHRATATGARLIIASNQAFPVGLSLGQTATMREIALRAGWLQVAPLQTFVLVLRPDRVLRDKMHPLMAGVAGVGLHLRQDVRRLLARPKEQRLSVRDIERFDSTHDELWDSVRHEYGCAVRRDASYLNWKYVTQPGQTFARLQFEREGRVVAAAVLLLTDADSAAYGYRRAFVVDLVVSPSDARLVMGVLEAVRQRCLAAGADTIVFHVINERLEKTLQVYGFSRRDPTRFLLAYPFQVSTDVRRRILTPARWLITMGDSDIDRPFRRQADARPQACPAALGAAASIGG